MSMHTLQFGNVDLNMLREQKAVLIDMNDLLDDVEDRKQIEATDGIINLLDAIQDYIEGRRW